MSKSTDIQDLRALVAMGTALLAKLEGTTETAPAVPAQPKAEKIYRSGPGKERAKAACAKVWDDAKAKARVKRVKDLPADVQDACRAECKAIWAAVPKTRTTKA